MSHCNLLEENMSHGLLNSEKFNAMIVLTLLKSVFDEYTIYALTYYRHFLFTIVCFFRPI